jgi:hypothetical protein
LILLGGSFIDATQPNTVYMMHAVASTFSVTGQTQSESVRALKKIMIGTGTLVLENDPGGLPNSIYTDANSPSDLFIQSNPAFSHNTIINAHDGKVGIGTINPSQKLEVAHNDGAGVAAGIALTNLSTTNKNSEIRFNQSGTALWAIGNDVAHNNSQNFFIYDNLINQPFGALRFLIDQNGNTGIGTGTPSEKLEVAHNDTHGGMALNRLSSTTSKSEIEFLQNGTEKWAIGNDLGENGGQNFFIWNNVATTTPFLIDQNGKVFIGNLTNYSGSNTLYKLYVEGGIATRDVKVTANAFPDYVFAKGYELIPISELDEYIKANKHLPGIPSAKEIEKNDGFEVGDMQTKLLEKIEEQSLYIIGLQKQLNELNNKLQQLSNK